MIKKARQWNQYCGAAAVVRERETIHTETLYKTLILSIYQYSANEETETHRKYIVCVILGVHDENPYVCMCKRVSEKIGTVFGCFSP